MNSTNLNQTVSTQGATKNNLAKSFATLTRGLRDQIDYVFPEITSGDRWRLMNEKEKKLIRRELFRLLHGNSPDFLMIKLSRLVQEPKGLKHE